VSYPRRGKVRELDERSPPRRSDFRMDWFSPLSDSVSGLLQEYERLCADISNYKRDRLFILGFTFTVVGSVVGIVAPARVAEQSTITAPSLSLIVGLLSFGLLALLAALVLTTRYSEAIERVASYMRVFIEPEVRGLKWETRLRNHRVRQSGRFSRLVTRTDRPVAVYYFVLDAGLATLTFPTGAWQSPWITPVWGLALANAALAVRLFRGIEASNFDEQWNQVAQGGRGSEASEGD
jgi:hypothetical protein